MKIVATEGRGIIGPPPERVFTGCDL